MIVVVQSGAKNNLRLFRRHAFDIQSLEYIAIPLRPQMQHRKCLPARPRDQFGARRSTRGHDRIEAIRGHADMRELLQQRLNHPRRIRQKHHRPALLAKPVQGIGGRKKRRLPVVQYAPHIADQRIVIARDVGKAGKDLNITHGLTMPLPSP